MGPPRHWPTGHVDHRLAAWGLSSWTSGVGDLVPESAETGDLIRVVDVARAARGLLAHIVGDAQNQRHLLPWIGQPRTEPLLPEGSLPPSRKNWSKAIGPAYDLARVPRKSLAAGSPVIAC